MCLQKIHPTPNYIIQLGNLGIIKDDNSLKYDSITKKTYVKHNHVFMIEMQYNLE